MKRLFTFICCLSFLLCGCSSSVTLQKQTFTIELGDDVYANPSLYIENPQKFDTDQMKVVALSKGISKKDNRFITGAQEYLVVGEYDFQLQTGKQNIDFKIKIKDTKPPTISSSVSEITVAKETIVNWMDYFSATDISGVSYSSSPVLDTSKEGDYSIMVKVSDRFGNNQEREVVVHVE